jgi:hypothetical protein
LLNRFAHFFADFFVAILAIFIPLHWQCFS